MAGWGLPGRLERLDGMAPLGPPLTDHHHSLGMPAALQMEGKTSDDEGSPERKNRCCCDGRRGKQCFCGISMHILTHFLTRRPYFEEIVKNI